MTPQQDSLLGVISCPFELRRLDWAAVKGELLHRYTSFLRCGNRIVNYQTENRLPLSPIQAQETLDCAKRFGARAPELPKQFQRS